MAWSLLGSKYVQVALEKSSTIVKKYLHLFIVGDLYGPQMSIWMSSKGNAAWEALGEKGDAWFLAKGQIVQENISELQGIESERDFICLRVVAEGCPNLECHSMEEFKLLVWRMVDVGIGSG